MKRISAIALGLLLALNLAPLAKAAIPASLSRSLALRIECLPDGAGVEGMQFRLYYVAMANVDGSYTVVEPYASAGVTEAMISDSSYRTEVLRILGDYINSTEGIEDYGASTYADGTVVVEGLADGVYLCASNTQYVLKDGTRYTPVPFLFRLNAELVANQVRASADTVTAVTKFRVSTPTADNPSNNPPPNNPPADNPPADNPPADNPPADNPPADNPPANNPPADNPPADNPPADNPPTDIPDDNPPTGDADAPPEGDDFADQMDIEDEDVPLGVVEIMDEPVPLTEVLGEFDEEEEPDEDVLVIDDEEVPLAEMLPQTGLLWWPVPLMAVSGLLLFVVGWKKMRHAAA